MLARQDLENNDCTRFINDYYKEKGDYVPLITALHSLLKAKNADPSKLIEYCYENYLYTLQFDPANNAENIKALQNLMRAFVVNFEKLKTFLEFLSFKHHLRSSFCEKILGWEHVANLFDTFSLRQLLLDGINNSSLYVVESQACEIFINVRKLRADLELNAVTWYMVITHYQKYHATKIYAFLTTNEKTALAALFDSHHYRGGEYFYEKIDKHFHQEANPNHPFYLLIKRVNEISEKYNNKKENAYFTFFTHKNNVYRLKYYSTSGLFKKTLTETLVQRELKDLILLLEGAFHERFGKIALENPDYVVNYLQDQTNHFFRRALAQALLAIYTYPELQPYITQKTYLTSVKRVKPQQGLTYTTIEHPALNTVASAMDIVDVIRAKPEAGLNFIYQLGIRIADLVKNYSQIKTIINVLPEEDRFAFFKELISARDKHCETTYDLSKDNLVLLSCDVNAERVELFNSFTKNDQEEFCNTYIQYSKAVLLPHLHKNNLDPHGFYKARRSPLYLVLSRVLQLCAAYENNSLEDGSIRQAHADHMITMRDNLLKRVREFKYYVYANSEAAENAIADVFKLALNDIEQSYADRVKAWRKYRPGTNTERMIELLNGSFIDRSLRFMANLLRSIYVDLKEYLIERKIGAKYRPEVMRINNAFDYVNLYAIVDCSAENPLNITLLKHTQDEKGIELPPLLRRP